MKRPEITLKHVQREAERFLKQYHPLNALPIPIEDIVELQMKIGLNVVKGIKQMVDTDAFINREFNEIFVDEHSFEKFPARTRFSIAHEIGHLVLHKDWYEQNGPKNIEDYLKYVGALDEQTYKYIERQANTFAGLVLIPTEHLVKLMKKHLGWVPSEEGPELLSGIIQDLPTIFDVSEMPILWRLQDEKMIKRVSFY